MSKSLKKLLESNMERAEIVLSIQSEIIQKLQRNAEVSGNLSIDVLGPLLDRMKAECGVEAAEEFNRNVAGYLQTVTKTTMDAKNKISTEVLKLTGDITSAGGITDLGAGDATDLGADTIDAGDEIDSPDFDIAADAGLDEPDLDSEPVPVDRNMKESRKIGVQLESTKGTKGKKFFESKEQMKKWLTDNQHKIKSVKVIR